MQHMHQNPEEAVHGHMLCNAETSIAHHWGTFQLTNEPIEEPIERLAQARLDQGLAEEDFVVLLPGQEWTARTGAQKTVG
jgi:L-ascorbate metabolism protein UlaG (beta-lactamase superfamily)